MTDKEQALNSSEQALTEEYEQKALVCQDEIGAIIVTDNVTFARMEAVAVNARDNEKALMAHIAPQKAEANKRHKYLTQLEKRLCEPFRVIQASSKRCCDTYTCAQRQIAEAMQQQAEEEARKKAEDLRLKQAEELETQGKQKEAEAVLEAPVAPAPVAPVEDVPQRKGMRETWYAEVIDEGLVPRKYLMVDEKALNAMAKALKGNFDVPGCVARKKMGG